jgi:hypothetical protein
MIYPEFIAMCSPSGRELAIRKRPLASHHIYEQATVVNVQLAARFSKVTPSTSDPLSLAPLSLLNALRPWPPTMSS